MVNVLLISIVLPHDSCGVKQMFRLALLKYKLHNDEFFGVIVALRKSADESSTLDFLIGVYAGLAA